MNTLLSSFAALEMDERLVLTIIDHAGRRTDLTGRDLKVTLGEQTKAFRAKGISPGQRVLLSMETSPEAVLTFLGLAYLGAVPVSIKPDADVEQQRLIAKQTGAAVAVSFDGPDRRPEFRPLQDVSCDGSPKDPVSAPDRLAFIQCTSGSTGSPRPIGISWDALTANLEATHSFDGRSQEDLGMAFVPLSHDMGLVGGLLGPIYIGHPTILIETAYFFRNMRSVLVDHARSATTAIGFPPSVLPIVSRLLIRSGRDHDRLAELRSLYLGSEPIRLDDVEALEPTIDKLIANDDAVVFGYGLAENTLIATTRRVGRPPDGFRDINGIPTASVGTAIGRTRVFGPEDHIGPIEIEGPSLGLLTGLRPGEEPSGPNRMPTGDEGIFMDGELYVVGRYDDAVNIGGSKVFLTDIDAVLAPRRGSRSALVAVPTQGGYRIAVTGKRAVTQADSRQIARAALDAVGVAPVGVHHVPRGWLQRTSSGKLRRRETGIYLDQNLTETEAGTTEGIS